MKSLLRLQDMITWLLSKQSMSPKKLQKMLYFEYSWIFATLNPDARHLKTSLFPATFEAWIHGPVIASVYQRFHQAGYDDSGRHNIPKNNLGPKASKNIASCVPKQVFDRMNMVFDNYKSLSSDTLSAMTYQDPPWKATRGTLKPFTPSQRTISNQAIFNCYYKKLTA